MFPEVVRPGALSRALHTQLRIGNAIEVLRLLQAGVPIEPSEFEPLSGVARLFQSGDCAGAAPGSSAISDASGEMFSAARAALAPSTMQDLQATLGALSEALAQVASTRRVGSTSVPIDDVVAKLGAIRRELAARATITTDESLSQLSA